MSTRLNALDMAFLALETQKTPVNVAGLQILEPPAGYKGNFVRDLLAELVTQKAGPPFNLKLSSTSPVPRPRWVVDRNFDIGYHVRHSALPSPGTMNDLLDLVSRLHSRVMDRERPLWELHIIEGLSGGRFAIYMKMHHAAIDGMGGIAILECCYSEDPAQPARSPWRGVPAPRRPYRTLGLLETTEKLKRHAAEQVRMGAGIGKLLLGHTMKLLDMREAHSPVPFTAPRSLFNVPISGARRFCTQTVSLARIKDVGKAAGATVNDIILAMCSGALRQYLLDKHALPERTLLATVPVSVRQIHRSGNQITYVGAKLATERKDPLKRLAEISQSTTQAKEEVNSVTPAAATTFAVMAQGLVAVLNRFHVTGWLPPPANVTISNVPGPRKPLYLGGAKMLANYPLSVLVDGQALNITVVSYCDSVDFGLMACRNTLPDVETIAEYLVQALEELEAAVVRREEKAQHTRAARARPGKPASGTAGRKPRKRRAAARPPRAAKRRGNGAAASSGDPGES